MKINENINIPKTLIYNNFSYTITVKCPLLKPPSLSSEKFGDITAPPMQLL